MTPQFLLEGVPVPKTLLESRGEGRACDHLALKI